MKHFVAENYFEVVSDVNDCWAKLKKLDGNYAQIFGVALFKR